jgi:polar amino acid transport system permease protein
LVWLIFGAFAGNVLAGSFKAVPIAQIQTGASFGMTQSQIFSRILVPQMWVFALPGLSNLWQILIKATPLLFLLGLQDIVYWARELGSSKTSIYAYPHLDWRLYYFGFLLIFYLGLTAFSEVAYKRIMARLSRRQATLAGSGKTGLRGGV